MGGALEGLNRIDVNANEVKQYKNDDRDENHFQEIMQGIFLRDGSGNFMVGTR